MSWGELYNLFMRLLRSKTEDGCNAYLKGGYED